MLITLDYYRILSVPIKATQEQIDQAFADRAQQQPRQEYSDFAIAARQKLLQQAYQVLSDASERAAYDAKFFTALDEGKGEIKAIAENDSETKTDISLSQVQLSSSIEASTSAITPSIEISPELLAGVLLIYYELAEYELILRIGVDYLNSNSNGNTAPTKENKLEAVVKETKDNILGKEDVILSVVLSYLELSREQWRRNNYENAAISGQMGINILEKEQLFSSLKDEIEMDVNKLKPYRILELLAKSPSDSPERLKGLQLLQEMICQRQGIEGKGNDYSGLTLEEFLHFIQQLRCYMTVKEQQKLFFAEARKGSGVAGFLAIYALVAQGYVHQQPQLILEAQKLLQLLSNTQDISWEKSICHLLLGQTKQAIKTIENNENNKESKIFKVIQDNSQDAPDLLPGICFYGEKWLKEEVLAQFWDLKSYSVTLDKYFSNPKVQDYLEQLSPVSTLVQASEKDPISKEPISGEKTKQRRNFFSWGKPKQASEKLKIQEASSSSTESLVASSSSTATLERQPQDYVAGTVALGTENYDFSGQGNKTNGYNRGNARSANQQIVSPSRRLSNRSQLKYKSPLWLIFLKGGLLFLGLIFSLGALSFFITKQTLNRDSQEITEATTDVNNDVNNLDIAQSKINEQKTPSVSRTKAEPDQQPKLPVFDNVSAEQVIQKWLDSKSAALGKSYQIDQLKGILVTDLLNKWTNTANHYKKTNTYRSYQHKIKIRSVVFEPKKPNLATVEAEVQEIAQHYQAGKLNSAQSYNDNLLVRYQLIRQDGSWLIQTSQVLKTL